MKFIRSSMNRIFGIIKPLSGTEPNPQVKKWFKDKGDQTHRLNYTLDEHSVVFDLGGYKGDWTAQVLSLYGCTVYIFEPYEEYFDIIKNKFKKNEKVKAFRFGLSRNNCTASLAVADNSSSVFSEGTDRVSIDLVNSHDFFKDHNITRIDLMKVNIEGGEYDLLEGLIESGDVHLIDNIQVQFHNFVPNARNRMEQIQSNLKKSHELTYQYEFVWENWKLKEK